MLIVANHFLSVKTIFYLKNLQNLYKKITNIIVFDFKLLFVNDILCLRTRKTC